MFENTSELSVATQKFSQALRASISILEVEVRTVAEHQGVGLAAKALRAVLVLSPGDGALTRTACQFCFGAEEWSLAARLARQAAYLDPGAVDADLMAATYLFRARAYEASWTHCTRARLATPAKPAPHFLAGRNLFALGQVEAGRQAIAKAVELSPDYRFAAQVMTLTLTTQDFDRVRAAVRSDSPGTHPSGQH
jgi:predicted Zn-dependent protease